ncbi:histone-lysine N-methyltransferase family member SUVH9-like [Macadamia integrifolia]|uniref:histone-lysine N-methyltransferase family member SUVH9-like n=1 Tax=Macadamia integrifolia TaxID=60698 RepID=UPI001C4EEDF6|nr:histone-lysine N-methyltransferase family member SUVH9-like [Macadamia integrifolia]XP_042516968.1 histone-lysine N-methyltransferase family member SUVH9-like [Macadamia integrifolia]XP_042516969.1 histone-lysine N-methyltransferase family member SUVH9-like [Macadamia integrifolia]
MGSLVPYLDLNLLPDHNIITPKVEPKLEPLYEEPYFSTPNANSSSYSNPDPGYYPESGSDAIQEISPVSEITAEGNDVYSEYYRITQLFQSAFAKKLQQYSDLTAVEPNSLAIVPQPEQTSVSRAVAKYKKHSRSGEMIRVTTLGAEDARYFRNLVRRTRMLYDSLRIITNAEDERVETNGRKTRGDLRAASLMRTRGLWLNRDKRIIGAIPGICVGDVFFYRMELCVIGLHGQLQAGIDYVTASQSSNGEPIATSIVVSGGYEDDEDAGDVIIYTGQGGQDKQFARQCVHQKLEGGNLALERSRYYGIEIRVIRGFKYERSITSKIYVYDGLYRIIDCWFDVGKSGFGVYKYKLLRMADQPEMGSVLLKLAENLRIKPLEARPSGYLSLDISKGREKLPVLLFNDIDSDQEPTLFEYLVKPVFPPPAFQHLGNSIGCNCVSGCSSGCFCAQRNGGEFPYDRNGILLRGKPLILECGSFCRCPPNCQNRVTQKGLRHRLEVFRSRETGWGVRSLDLIHAGSFICEYAGVMLAGEQVALFTMNGDSLVYPSRFPTRWMEWGDLSEVFPEFVRPSNSSIPPLDFAMDVSAMRNVACYVSHSSTPNVMVQFVLYDHHNILYPHLMLFALENIPPLRELSLDYGVSCDWTGKLAICN